MRPDSHIGKRRQFALASREMDACGDDKGHRPSALWLPKGSPNMLSSSFAKQGFTAILGLVFVGSSVAPCWGQDIPDAIPTNAIVTEPVNIPSAGPTNVPSALENNRPLATVPLPDLIDEAIAVTSRRPLDADQHTPWQIVHGVLALRQNYYIMKDGKPIKALDWIATNPTFDGKPWWQVTPHGGKGHPFTKPYHFEGHPNQFAALFTLSRLPLDYSFKAGDKSITMADIINNAKMEANDEEEMTWTLWLLAFYVDPATEWHNQKGEPWSFERLIIKQMKTPVTTSACGGMHGLFAIASARNAHLQARRALTGTWLEAHIHLQRHIETAKKMQNPDGSFSSNYFKGPGQTNDISKRISTTGHTLEMLMGALPQAELAEPYIQNAARRIATDLIESRKESLEPGGMYHALNALIIYRERMWPERIKQPVIQEASKADSQGTSLR